MSAPKQPSPGEHNEEGSSGSSQIQDLVSRLTLETRLHAELRKNYDDMIESSEDCIKTLQEEIVTLEQKQWHEREKMQDVINGLTIKCQILERKRDVCENVEEISLMKIKDLNALEDEIEMREEAFYCRQSKAYRKATQKYQESVAEASQSIAQEAVIAYLDTHGHSLSKDAQSSDKGKSLKANSSHNEVKVINHIRTLNKTLCSHPHLQKYGRNSTAEFLDKQLSGLRASKKDLALEVEILEEANRQQAKTILYLRKRLAAKLSESSHNDQDFDVSQSDGISHLSASSLFGIVPSLSNYINGNAPNSSDEDGGSSTMLTECRSNFRKSASRDINHHNAATKFVSKTTRPSTAENFESPSVNSFSTKSTRSSRMLRPPSRTSNTTSSVRRGTASPKESPSHITWSQPHPEYEEVLRVCQTAKISDTAQAIMQNKNDESGTRLLIRLLSGLHPDPQLCAQ